MSEPTKPDRAKIEFWSVLLTLVIADGILFAWALWMANYQG